MEDDLSFLERRATGPHRKSERMLKRCILWLGWSLICIGFGYVWAWEAMGGTI